MDLHQSGEQNLYLRQSFFSNSDNARSFRESRIMYNRSETSFNKWVKLAFSVILLLFLAIVWSSFGKNNNDLTQCQNESRLSYLFARLEAKVFGKISPDRCKLKKEVTTEKTETSEVTTVTQIKTCPLENEKQEETSWWKFWRYFQTPCPENDKLRAHQNNLQKLKSSIRPFKSLIPDVKEIESDPKQYLKLTNMTSVDLNNQDAKPEIIKLFSEIKNDKTFQHREHPHDVSHPDFLTPISDLDFLLKTQLKSRNILLSSSVLSKKEEIIENLESTFRAIENNQTCAQQMLEIKRGIDISEEKKNYSSSIIADHQSELAKLRRLFDELVKRKYNDENGPLKKLHLLDQEIEELSAKKNSNAKLAKQINDLKRLIASSLLALEENQSELRKAELSIKKNEERDESLKPEIKDLKLKYDNLIIKIGVLQWKLDTALRNLKIKEFLMSLLKKEGSGEDSMERLMNESEVSKAEIVKIVRAFLLQSKGYEIETNISEDEMTEILEKDKKDFDEIMKVYRELKDMIEKYKELEFDIKALRKEIVERELERNETEKQYKALLSKQKSIADDRLNREKEIANYLKIIKNLESENEKNTLKIKEGEDFLAKIESDFQAKNAEREEYRKTHKVV